MNNDMDTLKVLVWNVWRGTNEVEDGPEKALQLIKNSQADICLLQESYEINGKGMNFGPWASQELGWNHWQGDSPHLCVMSHHAISKTFFHEPWHCLGAEFEDHKGRNIYAFSTWIDYKCHVADHLKDNPDATDADLMACETTYSKRLEQTHSIIAYLRSCSIPSAQSPLLIGGDWNCPSHLDWTKQTCQAFDHRRPLALPVSKFMQEAGYSDSFRSIHPDPVMHPGNTWSPLFRNKNGVELPKDRIDRLYYHTSGRDLSIKPVHATVFPEVLEDDDIPVRKRLFPSDHAALLIEFYWKNV